MVIIMSKTFERKMSLAKIVLSKLADGKPQRWTKLLKMTLRDCGTPHTFESILAFLVEKGYIEKVARGVYRITAKGQDFLKAL